MSGRIVGGPVQRFIHFASSACSCSLQFSGGPARTPGNKVSATHIVYQHSMYYSLPASVRTGCWSPVLPAPRRGRTEFLGAKRRCAVPSIHQPPRNGAVGVSNPISCAVNVRVPRFFLGAGTSESHLVDGYRPPPVGQTFRPSYITFPGRADSPHLAPCTSGRTAQICWRWSRYPDSNRELLITNQGRCQLRSCRRHWDRKDSGGIAVMQTV